jgi:chromosome segregation ATPase
MDTVQQRLEEENERLRADNNELRAKLTEKQQYITELQAKYAHVQFLLDEAWKEKHKLQDECDRAKAEHERTQALLRTYTGIVT